MSEKVRTDNRIVEKVRVVVHTTGPWPSGRMSDNHWSIYLILAGSETSVRMNMSAAHDDPKGHLEWSPSLPYTKSNSAIKSWDYEAAAGISVKKIYTVVINNGRDKYSMSGGGSGCRYWVYIIVKDLENEGYLQKKEASADLWKKLLFQYSNTGHTKALPMVKGEFTFRDIKKWYSSFDVFCRIISFVCFDNYRQGRYGVPDSSQGPELHGERAALLLLAAKWCGRP